MARGGLPDRAALIEFIRESPSPVGKREIARAFRVDPEHRQALRDMLREIERSGAATRAANRRLVAMPEQAAASLPEVTVLECVGRDEDGTPMASPVAWPGTGPVPVARVVDLGAVASFPIGSRAAARLIPQEGGIEAVLIRRLDPAGERSVGVFRRGREGGRIQPADRRDRSEYRVAARDDLGAADGELVVAEILPTRRLGLPQARIIQRLGDAEDPGAVSLAAIARFELPLVFPPEAIAEAEKAQPVGVEGRTDLRDVALVTIDGSDARDFDDAVWAEPDTDPENAGGWHLIVAIADVSWYVRPDSALDREAVKRGNSVYFPDRVVPMLPEALSNELCSLKPEVERACLAAHLWIGRDGRKRAHRFVRGLMRSAARLTYEAAQAMRDGTEPLPPSLPPQTITALYGAFAALDRARQERGALELDLVEHRVVLDAETRPVAVVARARLDSHKLIEEFMILANVAAAEQLEAWRQPCVYRIHDSPDPEKVSALSEFLAELGVPGLALAKGQAPKPALFNQVLRRAAETPQMALVNDLVLRAQAQASYDPANIGHFGLALRRYAHFTSPIRRYADLLIHRALVSGGNAAGQGFGEGGLPPGMDREALAEIATHISTTERRAAAAERSAVERYRAILLSRSVDQVFEARINGVARFGLFVTVADSGTDGLVPISSLPNDYYRHEERSHRLVGERSQRVFALGDLLRVRLVEADATAGRLVFHVEPSETDQPGPGDPGRPAPHRKGEFSARPGNRGRPGRGGKTGRAGKAERRRRPS